MNTALVDCQTIADELEGTAWWREQKASEFPDDAKRNLNAAAELRALAGSFSQNDVDLELLAAYSAIWFDEERGNRAAEEAFTLRSRIGFGASLASPNDYLEFVISAVGRVE